MLLLAGLCYHISPVAIWNSVRNCSAAWVLAAASMTPLFLLARFGKWYVLAKQSGPTHPIAVAKGYLIGMAWGIITPGRLGEIARIRISGLPKSCYVLYVIEKCIEVIVMLYISMISACVVKIISAYYAIPLLLLGMWLVFYSKHHLSLLLHTFRWLPLYRDAEKRSALIAWFQRIRLTQNICLTAVVQIIFSIQAYIIIWAMGYPAPVSTIFLATLVSLGNLLPISVGGIGVRETIAVILLGHYGVPQSAAFNSFFLVSVCNLLIPSVLGAVLSLRTIRKLPQ